MSKRYPFHFLAIFLFLFITSCSVRHAHDGPPNYYVDETRVPNAVPKAEPLAKYGNMQYYDVRGKRYYVMKSSKHYDEVGIASWYGTQFHSHRTSSGERYNMLAMTAAHKTLPLPTYVRVTNLKNHRFIIVKVNDRGPFAPHRIIDLSYVAAKKLGMLGHGTTTVRVTAIDPHRPTDVISPRHSSSSPARLAKNTSHYAPTSKLIYVQAGAFSQRHHAEKLRASLQAKLDIPIRIISPSSASHLYRVQIGPVRDLASATRVNQKLRQLGFKKS